MGLSTSNPSGAVETDPTALKTAALSVDGTLTANSDVLVPSQKAVKTYADGKPSNSAGVGIIPVSNGTDLIASGIADDGSAIVSGGYVNSKFLFDGDNSTIGDVDGTNHSTKIVISDSTQQILLTGNTFKWNGTIFDFTIVRISLNGDAGSPSAIDLTNATNVYAAVIRGTTTNDSAANGFLGFYTSASVVQGSAVALTTATPKTVTSISLTPGDWDVTAIGAITGASTGTEFDVAISTTTNSMAGTVLGNSRCQTPTVSLAGADATLMIPGFRVSIASTTTYYLIVQETFTIGSPAAYGRISARRVR